MNMRIKLGAFGKLKNYPDMDRAEYDYAELDSVEIAQLSEERFEKAKEMLSDGGLKTLVFARALPYDEPIFHGNDFLWDKFQKFVPDTPDVNRLTYTTNSYDNALLYTDFVIINLWIMI